MQNLEEIQKKAEEVAGFMKCFANPCRLMILCHLSDGVKSVSELMALTGIPQTSMSQHLSKLKREKLIDYDREHRTLYYKIIDPDVIVVMGSLMKFFARR